jgi:4-aminobutyrate aminotransferase-like enzyme
MKPAAPSFEGEPRSNEVRQRLWRYEPKGLRTYTPTLAILDRSAGVFHYTPEGRRLYDYTSGVLVANLGHNPRVWLERVLEYLGWNQLGRPYGGNYVPTVPLSSYNAGTELEALASVRLVEAVRSRPGGELAEQVLWAASGSEAVQKALWACLARHRGRPYIWATRDGFHGKKGLAAATSGNEDSPERDPRVRFVSFPKEACRDVSEPPPEDFDTSPYEEELKRLWRECDGKVACLITEPYLGAAGSYHPPRQYLQLLEHFCKEHDIIFILDEIQSGFGRTGTMFAFEKYGIQPDIVVLGKGMGNGLPVSAAVGRADVLEQLDYGEASDTFSGNPLACAGVLATLDCFEPTDIISHVASLEPEMLHGLCRLKELPFVRHVRGEGMVWGVEIGPYRGQSAAETACACIRRCYLGTEHGEGIHLMGPLADCVLRISPPLVISHEDLSLSLELFYELLSSLR